MSNIYIHIYKGTLQSEEEEEEGEVLWTQVMGGDKALSLEEIKNETVDLVTPFSFFDFLYLNFDFVIFC